MTALLDSLALHILPTLNVNVANFTEENHSGSFSDHNTIFHRRSGIGGGGNNSGVAGTGSVVVGSPLSLPFPGCKLAATTGTYGSHNNQQLHSHFINNSSALSASSSSSSAHDVDRAGAFVHTTTSCSQERLPLSSSTAAAVDRKIGTTFKATTTTAVQGFRSKNSSNCNNNQDNWTTDKDPNDLSPNQNAVPFDVIIQPPPPLQQQQQQSSYHNQIQDSLRYGSSRQNIHEYHGPLGEIKMGLDFLIIFS